MRIVELTEFTQQAYEDIRALMLQLAPSDGVCPAMEDAASKYRPSQEWLRGIIASDTSHIFVAMEDGAPKTANPSENGVVAMEDGSPENGGALRDVPGRIVACGTLCMYASPTGAKATVEDVVVSTECRGKGLGRLLMEYIIAEARRIASDSVSGTGILECPLELGLTSRPSRVAANRLYQSMGFRRKETNVYRMELGPEAAPEAVRERKAESPERVVFLDWLRLIACFLVILTHSNEPVYLGGQGTAVASASDAFWSTFFVSLSRCCVPLFVLASSYLLFPVKGSTGPFLRRRLTRVGIPALVWLVLYCAFSGTPGECFTRLAFNFPMAAGHLWFCYMILGLYLLMPLLTPWAEKVGRRELLAWIGLWGFTTLIPLVRQVSISLTGTWSVWGEANWSEFGTFYYVSGYVGYLLLGLYFRRFVGELSWRRTLSLAVPLFTGGFAIAAAWFYGTMPKSFPFDEPLRTAVNMETLERNCTVSVLMMTLGAFLCIRKINSCGSFYRRIVLPVSKASYGVYLMHIFALLPLYGFWRKVFAGAVSAFWATPLVVVCTAVSTYVVCCVVSVLLQRIPRVGKYIVG